MESVSATPGPFSPQVAGENLSARSLPTLFASGAAAVPLFHAACLFAMGIVFARWVWLRPAWVLIAIAAVAALCILAALRAQRIAVLLPMAILWLLLGAWCAEMEPLPAPSPALATLSDGLLRTLDGTVVDAGPVRTELDQSVDEPAVASPSQRLDLRVDSLEAVNDESDRQEAVRGGVRLTVRWPQEIPLNKIGQGFRCGERIRAVVRLLPPETYRDPDVWSRADYLLDHGITSTGSATVDQVESPGTPPYASLACRIGGWQNASAARLLALPAAMRALPAPLRLSEDDAVMLSAMVAGDRTYLTHRLRIGFERTGSFHMLVVSGLHLAVLAACILWITRRLRIPRVPATLITIAASFAYALFTGFAVPVQRSLWMVTLYLLGRLIYRERNALNTIGFAALCLLVASPRSLFDASLQMTLLAVIAIAGIAMPLLAATVHPYWSATRDLKLVAIDIKLAPKLAQFRLEMRMLAERLQLAANGAVAWRFFPWAVRSTIRIVELVAVTCAVELAMTLPMAIYFHRITLFALPVNLIILPLLVLLLPAALLTLLALAIWPTAAVVPAVAVALVLHLSIGLVHLFGSFALADFRVPTPLLWEMAVFCLLLALAIALACGGAAISHRGLRASAWAALALAALVAVVPRPIDRPRSALLVEAIDVGQGDSLLVIAPDGKTLLVDGGGFGGGFNGGPRQSTQDFDIGEDVVSPALWARGIWRLDAVALTHAHADHMGGMPAVLRNFHPTELWVGNNPRFGAYDALLDEAAALHVRVKTFRAGDAFSFGGVDVRILAPFRNYQPGAEPTNNDSLVMHVAYGATSVMLEGDAEAPIEDAMLAEPNLKSTLLKVGHHGSITSTRPEFLSRVAPQWAVISCGLHNHYGHPREEVLEELQNAQIKTFRTDINGASCFVLDGRTAWEEMCNGVRAPP